MPPVKKPRKSANPGKNQYSAELSPSQLVLGIAILLIFGLACFLFGVLVGKFDPSLNERVVRVPESEQLAKANLVPEATPTTQPKTSSTPPKASPEEPVVTPPSASKPIEEKTVVVRKEPVESPAKPTQPASSIPDTAQVTTTDLPPEEPAKAATPEVEQPESPKIEVPAGTPVGDAEIVTAQATTQPEVQKPVEPEKPTTPTGPVWSVQLSAFNSKENAEVERARLEKLIPYKIETYTPANSLWTKVLVGRYATRAEADAFRKKLVASYPVKDSILTERK